MEACSLLVNLRKGMQSSSEQPSVGEENCVTTLITTGKETMLNDTFVCLLLYAAWTCFRTDDVRQLRCSSHVTFVCHTDKDTLQRWVSVVLGVFSFRVLIRLEDFPAASLTINGEQKGIRNLLLCLDLTFLLLATNFIATQFLTSTWTAWHSVLSIKSHPWLNFKSKIRPNLRNTYIL